MVHIPAPPSKSVSHRMLMAAALAPGETIISNVLESDDLFRTISVLQSGGIRFQRLSEGVYSVTASPLNSGMGIASCNVGESGTTCRLCTALLAAGKGRFRVHGTPRMHERPLGMLTCVLQELGVRFTFEEKEGYPPFLMETDGLSGGEVTLSLEESSQYLSGLLLAAPLAKEPLVIYIGGRHVVSWPYIGLTLQVMKSFGIRFDVSIWDSESKKTPHWRAVDWKTLTEIIPGAIRFRVRPSQYKHGAYVVEGDWSGASYFLAAGALGKNSVTVSGINRHSLQADKAIAKILEQMGARVEYGSVQENSVTVYPSELKAISIDMSDCPDIVPTVAVLASFAYGETHIYGVAHLRIKECDRLSAMTKELRKLGVELVEEADGLRIKGLLKEEPITQAERATKSTGGYGLLSKSTDDKVAEDTTSSDELKENSPEKPEGHKIEGHKIEGHKIEGGNIVAITNENLSSTNTTNTIGTIDITTEATSKVTSEVISESISEIDFSNKHFDVNTYDDHRIAMSMALFMCAGASITFDNEDVVKKSFPEFWNLWKELLA